jgi:hypothetical protein
MITRQNESAGVDRAGDTWLEVLRRQGTTFTFGVAPIVGE